MITITPAAADQIRTSADQGGNRDLAMRIAAKRNPDGSIHYGMGFDEQRKDDDVVIPIQGLEIVIDPQSNELMDEATMDFVELEPGQFNFIFMNPLDPNYMPPKKKRKKTS